jgi:hypothetical protein
MSKHELLHNDRLSQREILKDHRNSEIKQWTEYTIHENIMSLVIDPKSTSLVPKLITGHNAEPISFTFHP